VNILLEIACKSSFSSYISFELGLLACSNTELTSEMMNILKIWQEFLDGLSARHKRAQHRKMRTHIHALSGIRTHNPSVQAVEDCARD
jgi:hypothetical protein